MLIKNNYVYSTIFQCFQWYIENFILLYSIIKLTCIYLIQYIFITHLKRLEIKNDENYIEKKTLKTIYCYIF